MNNNKFTSRKFILICVVQLLLFLSLWFEKLPPEVFQSLTMVIVSAYVLGNVSERVLTKEGKS
jgi:hypothetical protein